MPLPLSVTVLCSMVARFRLLPLLSILMPAVPLFLIVVLRTFILPPLELKRSPSLVKPSMTQSSMKTRTIPGFEDEMLMPRVAALVPALPFWPLPFSEMPRKRTVLSGSLPLRSVRLTLIAVEKEGARIEVKVPVPSMVNDLMIVTVPNPPGSRTFISPSVKVFDCAVANVLQGAVRVHGLPSSPTPDTHERSCWAWAAEAPQATQASIATRRSVNLNLFISGLLFGSCRLKAVPKRRGLKVQTECLMKAM